MSKEVLTNTERRNRAVKSLSIAEDRLNVINRRLPELETELQGLIVINEIQGYKNRTIQKAQSEIKGLQEERTTLLKTIEALKKALPEFEKKNRLEEAEKTVTAFEEAKDKLIDLLKGIPSLDSLKAEIEKIERYRDALEQSQGKFFDLLQTVNRFLIEENLEAVGNVTIATLKTDKGCIDYQDLLALSDNLIDAGETLNDLQYQIFKIGIAQVEVKNHLHPYVNEVCNCGFHKREFRPADNLWWLWENKESAEYFDKWTWTVIGRDSGFDRKPEFPCEIKSTNEFPKTEFIEVTKKSETQMVYDNENKQVRDPDKSTQSV